MLYAGQMQQGRVSLHGENECMQWGGCWAYGMDIGRVTARGYSRAKEHLEEKEAGKDNSGAMLG